MYERMGSNKDELSGLIVVETDDLLGGGVGDKFLEAVAKLKNKFNFGKWKNLSESATEYGGRTLMQHSDYSITISMARYLRGRARGIRLARSRLSDPQAATSSSSTTAPSAPSVSTQPAPANARKRRRVDRRHIYRDRGVRS